MLSSQARKPRPCVEGLTAETTAAITWFYCTAVVVAIGVQCRRAHAHACFWYYFSERPVLPVVKWKRYGVPICCGAIEGREVRKWFLLRCRVVYWFVMNNNGKIEFDTL